MSKKSEKTVQEPKGNYTAKITDATKEFSLPENKSYLDIRFDILLDGQVVAERRLGFPLGTDQDAILAELKKYCVMYENDHALAAEAAERSEKEAEGDKVLAGLKGVEV